MPTATALSDSKLHLTEPVKTLLHGKGPAIWSISPEATVYQAIELMAEKHIGALVVLMAGNLVGIISERDYARKVILKGKQSTETHVREIMTRPVLYVTPDQSIEECMRLMSSRRLRHLPVVEDEKVVGIVSIGDLVNWVITTQEQTIQHLQSYITGAYPG
jgi:CBS domain-containing protein